MARIKSGITGGFSGAIGSVQGASWKGIDYMQKRITSNGNSQTNKAVYQRKAFANCRNALSQLKDSWMNYVVGNGSKKLPAWPTWVKLVNSSFTDEPDFLLSHPLIAKGNFYPKPLISSPQVFEYSTTYVVQFTVFNPVNLITCGTYYAMWNRSLNKFLLTDGAANSFTTSVSFLLYKKDFPAGDYCLFVANMASGFPRGRCSDSITAGLTLP